MKGDAATGMPLPRLRAYAITYHTATAYHYLPAANTLLHYHRTLLRTHTATTTHCTHYPTRTHLCIYRSFVSDEFQNRTYLPLPYD